MTDTFAKFVRVAFVSAIALVGFLMALVLVVSTAVAVGIFYIIAKLRGKPFLASTYWNAMSKGGLNSGFKFRGGRPEQAHATAQPAGSPSKLHVKRADIIDVEARDVP
jgi:hypothetical protein